MIRYVIRKPKSFVSLYVILASLSTQKFQTEKQKKRDSQQRTLPGVQPFSMCRTANTERIRPDTPQTLSHLQNRKGIINILACPVKECRTQIRPLFFATKYKQK